MNSMNEVYNISQGGVTEQTGSWKPVTQYSYGNLVMLVQNSFAQTAYNHILKDEQTSNL